MCGVGWWGVGGGGRGDEDVSFLACAVVAVVVVVVSTHPQLALPEGTVSAWTLIDAMTKCAVSTAVTEATAERLLNSPT